jgi:hypothetical protein
MYCGLICGIAYSSYGRSVCGAPSAPAAAGAATAVITGGVMACRSYGVILSVAASTCGVHHWFQIDASHIT